MKAVKKLLALVLLFAMILSLFPALSAQATSAVWDGTVDISWYDPAKTEYYINTPAQLAGLAALVNGMTDPNCPEIIGNASYIQSIAYPNTLLVGSGGGNVSDTVYGSNIDFAYKTVYLTADMDMGGVYANGAWSGPNWTPIGGKFPMKPEVIQGDCYVLDTRFNGVLDGQGHTVKNIYCNRYAEKGFPYSMAVGLVGFLGGVKDGEGASVASFTNGWQPSVRNIVVGKGYIYARRMVGGVVGRIGTTSNGIIIENCANFADIRNTDSKGIGGIVGSGWGSGVIRNCYNMGSVGTTYACPAGGICGSNSGLDIYNCYNVGTIDSNGQKRGRGIGGHDSGSYTVSNCFYLEGCDDDPESGGWYTGNSRRITVNVKAMSAQQMKTQAFIDTLNASGTVFVADTANINGGYPILYFQAANYSNSRNFNVTVTQPAQGGTISADRTGEIRGGETVTLSAQANAGWRLNYFTLNGKALEANFFTVSADSTVSAVFTVMREVKLTLPTSEDSYLSFSKTGYETVAGKLEYVSGKALKNGDLLLEGDVISVTAIPYANAAPRDLNMEYIGSYVISATNAEKSTDGTFRVTGAGDITFSVTQETSKKSWISIADTSWYTGASDTYTLTTAAQLAGMAKLVNVEGVDFDGVTIRLGNDISLANNDGTIGERIWEPCGKNSSRRFSGTFDGGGYSIYDMTAYSAGSYAGLFGYCHSAVIKNVTVRGTVTGEAGSAYAAGIVAYASSCVIENCVNRAVITAYGTGAAGIAAYTCDGTVVENCVNRASVSGTSGVGGIVGICYSSEDIVRNCENYGTVTSRGDGTYGTGGITGQLAGLMSYCGNFADVTSADRYTGGLVGYTSSRIYSKIENSISTGAVKSSSANQSAAVGSAVGYAQYLTFENISATGAVTTSPEFKSPSKGGLIGREGSVTAEDASDASPLPVSTADSDKWTQPAAKQAPWTVTFTADGTAVATQTYSSATQTITPPAVPEKAGYTANWAAYALGSQDIVIKAIYRPIIARGGDTITKSGTYFLDPGASSDISISAGLSVTLNGTLGVCDGLSVTAEKGATLTLENVSLSGAKTLLTLNGGTLTLKGENSLKNSSDVRDNANPTISISGNETIDGYGTLYVSADIGNSAVNLAEGAALEQKGAVLTLVKEGLLGEAGGGAIFASNASVTISGGTLSGYTNSDNVPVISARTLTITRGTVRAQAAKSPIAIEANSVTINGGTLLVSGHTGNSSSTAKAYSGAEAIKGLSGSPSCTFETALSFDDVRVTDDYFNAIRAVYNAGYFTGMSATEFSPNTGMTRAMFVTVLYRMAGSPAVSSGTAFTDLTQDWYRNAVIWAVEKGITAGTSATTFSPNAQVTIEQTALFLSRYAKLSGKTAAPINGDNASGSSPWARAAAAWAVECGILPKNCEFGRYATRAELANAINVFSKM